MEEQLNVIQSLLKARETLFHQIAFLTERVDVLSKKLESLESKYEKFISQINEEKNLEIGINNSVDYNVFPKHCSFIRYPEDPSFALRENLKQQAEEWINNPKTIPLSLKNLLDKETNNQIAKLNKLIKDDMKKVLIK